MSTIQQERSYINEGFCIRYVYDDDVHAPHVHALPCLKYDVLLKIISRVR